jgi:hypothetical protein
MQTIKRCSNKECSIETPEFHYGRTLCKRCYTEHVKFKKFEKRNPDKKDLNGNPSFFRCYNCGANKLAVYFDISRKNGQVMEKCKECRAHGSDSDEAHQRQSSCSPTPTYYEPPVIVTPVIPIRPLPLTYPTLQTLQGTVIEPPTDEIITVRLRPFEGMNTTDKNKFLYITNLVRQSLAPVIESQSPDDKKLLEGIFTQTFLLYLNNYSIQGPF